MYDMNTLVSLDSAALCRVLAGRAPEPSSLGPQQWRTVVEDLTFRLSTGGDVPSSVPWTRRSAALVYALDAAVASGDMDGRERVTRLLELSSLLISRVAPMEGVVVLDPTWLVELFFTEVPITAREAGNLAAHWRDLDISEIRRLRAARNLATPAVRLARIVGGTAHARLRDWEIVLPQLP
ncbi:hypothetical protein [Streptomyces montanisoli]|uniref:Uncharacterized protein n=1 Tax=Streptomyces montanisoli TaxID=2798581 RepID=A0A940MEA5_9ACTN|nr:hypothetical protein [Streptomyces montanisoli]MBP0458420.1 hypothetical protein [Streptomyces montanisoli]